jgi:hypothetical protein
MFDLGYALRACLLRALARFALIALPIALAIGAYLWLTS